MKNIYKPTEMKKARYSTPGFVLAEAYNGLMIMNDWSYLYPPKEVQAVKVHSFENILVCFDETDKMIIKNQTYVTGPVYFVPVDDEFNIRELTDADYSQILAFMSVRQTFVNDNGHILPAIIIGKEKR